MEFAAVQIIAVDTERKSGLLIAGYLMNAGDFSKNNVSTGDLNRGRRVKPRLLFGSFCRSKKNKPVFLSGAFHCMESMPLSVQHALRAKELRGFANLESAHGNSDAHKTKLGPCRFAAKKPVFTFCENRFFLINSNLRRWRQQPCRKSCR